MRVRESAPKGTEADSGIGSGLSVVSSSAIARVEVELLIRTGVLWTAFAEANPPMMIAKRNANRGRRRFRRGVIKLSVITYTLSVEDNAFRITMRLVNRWKGHPENSPRFDWKY